jgi:hypothetical protein
MLRRAVQRERDADTEREGMPMLRSVILREQGAGMQILRESNTDAKREQCRC